MINEDDKKPPERKVRLPRAKVIENIDTRRKQAAKKALRAQKDTAKKSLRAAEARAIRAKKKLDAIDEVTDVILEGKNKLVTEDILATLAPNVREEIENNDIIFKPNPGPQTEFLAAVEQEVFYGGARGGGKTYAIIIDPLRYCDNPNMRGLIIRKTMPELRDMIFKSQMLYPKAFPGAKWREQEKEWRFPSGARIEFGYCENTQDAMRYIGQSYPWIGVDELPHFPSPDVYNMLRSSNRSVDPRLPAQMRATGNPGAVGSTWVKQVFIDPAPPNTRFTENITINLPGKTPFVTKITKKYIPATIFDNPYLTYDTSYVTMLSSLPEMQRRQWLEGDWTAFDGAAFPEFKDAVHVVDDFVIPSNWMRFRSMDWGYSSPYCCLWIACDWDGNLWVYDELYGKQETADVVARKILDRENGHNIRYGVLDSSTWSSRGEIGPPIAETMVREGCRWRPSDRSPRSRVHGKLEIHRRLAINSTTEEPSLKFLRKCRNLIRTLPLLPLDDSNIEDVDTDAEDHAYDALRYGVMTRPMAGQVPYDLRDSSIVQQYRPADRIVGY